MYKGVLFVDIDGTVLRDSLFVLLVKALVRKGVFPASVKKYYAKEEEAYRYRQYRSAYVDFLRKMIEVFETNVKGVRVKDLIKAAKEVVEEHKDEVHAYTRYLIRKALKNSWYVVAISSSQKETVAPFAKYWGIQETHATELGRRGGRYNGVRKLLLDKAKIVRKVLKRPEFRNIPRKNIVAVGDSEGDICMLEQVGKPVCFNPTQGLFDEAVKRNWSVVVEKKGVVYNI